MMDSKIQRVNIDHYNNTGYTYPLSLGSAKNEEFINQPENYQVVVEKLEVPVNGPNMPINNDETPFTIIIFNESKTIPDLPYGVNTFTFNGPFYSVDDFLRKVNDITQKRLSAYTSFGQFILEDKVIKYVRNNEYDGDYNIFKLYFDGRLMNLLTFPYDTTDVVNVAGVKAYRFNLVTEPAATPYKITSVTESRSTFSLFFTLKAIRVYSDLPTIPYKVYNMTNKTLEDNNLLTEVIFNSVENYNESNLIYIPTVFRHSSMSNAESLRNIHLSFRYKYANGEEKAIMIEPFQYSSITIAFFPIKKDLDNFL